ncbi:hypothetical protein ACGFZA_40155 [Streptomyces sp. NPDC048211]|uniref:hypothetical protein n=1 Tax=Streptomyces sp. NPDC048211 TaxID=3365516 RepID=UPI0037141B05
MGGRWEPAGRLREHCPRASPAQHLAAAITIGDHFFASSSSTPDYDEYHQAMLRHLQVDASALLLAKLRRKVPTPVFLETHPDVMETPCFAALQPTR